MRAQIASRVISAAIVAACWLAAVPSAKSDDDLNAVLDELKAGAPDQEGTGMVIPEDGCADGVFLRVHLSDDGTITGIDELSDLSTEHCRDMSSVARDAVLRKKWLEMPEGQIIPSITLKFAP